MICFMRLSTRLGIKSDKYWCYFHSIPIKIDTRDEMKIWETALGWDYLEITVWRYGLPRL
jgi:hypothetical protein